MAIFAPPPVLSSVVSNFVESGGIITIGSGTNISISAATVWIAGQRVVISAYASAAQGVSTDGYYDADLATLTFIKTEVSNNAASPALSANRIRVGIAIANASVVTTLNQGSTTATAPTVSSVILTVADSLGNLIYPTNPNPGLLSYRSDTSGTFTVNTSADTDITRLAALPVIVPTGYRIKLTAFANEFVPGGSANSRVQFKIYEGVTQLASENVDLSATNVGIGGIVVTYVTPSAGLHTYKATLARDNINTVITLSASGTSPACLSAELV